MLFITAELAFICINRSRLGYKDVPELKIEGNQSLILSFTHTYELEQQRYLSAPPWHMGAHLPSEVTDQLSSLLQEPGEPEEAGHR